KHDRVTNSIAIPKIDVEDSLPERCALLLYRVPIEDVQVGRFGFGIPRKIKPLRRDESGSRGFHRLRKNCDVRTAATLRKLDRENSVNGSASDQRSRGCCIEKRNKEILDANRAAGWRLEREGSLALFDIGLFGSATRDSRRRGLHEMARDESVLSSADLNRRDTLLQT